jgi:hydroxymethylbilane synthase
MLTTTTRHYRIGTRGSALALTQTSLVKESLEKISNHSFELVTVSTTGDQDTSKPLVELEGQNFFTKELDEALLEGKVDLIVSSLKDTGSSRPEGIVCGAITKRNFAEDILLVKKTTSKAFPWSGSFRVGTSSPRRIAFCAHHLKDYLPTSPGMMINAIPLRGNVTTRITKLIEGEFDAIILALAGLERLALHPSSCEEMQILLRDLDFFVLPRKTCTPAPGQGALVIETLETNRELLSLLTQINDPETSAETDLERKRFHVYGGGCHQAIGINVKKFHDTFVAFESGLSDQTPFFTSTLLKDRPSPKGEICFMGLGVRTPPHARDELSSKELLDLSPLKPRPSHIFVSSSHVMVALKKIHHAESTVWAAGASTVKAIAAAGFWTNGCCDSCGEKDLKRFLASRSLKLMMPSNLVPLSLGSDTSVSEIGRSIPCYRTYYAPPSPAFRAEIETVRTFFWASFAQFKHYRSIFPEISGKDYLHCCGIGKTWESFRKEKIPVIPFADMAEFKRWFERKNP